MKSRTKSKAFDTGFFGPSELLGPEVSDDQHHCGQDAKSQGSLEQNEDNQCNQGPADDFHHQRHLWGVDGDCFSLALTHEHNSTNEQH